MINPSKVILLKKRWTVHWWLFNANALSKKNGVRLKIFHSGKTDQDMTVITFFTFIKWRKDVKQNEGLREDTPHKVDEVHETTARKHRTFSKKYDATEFVEINGF